MAIQQIFVAQRGPGDLNTRESTCNEEGNLPFDCPLFFVLPVCVDRNTRNIPAEYTCPARVGILAAISNDMQQPLPPPPPPPTLVWASRGSGRGVCHEHGSRLRREVVVAVAVRYSGVTTLNPLTRRVPRLNINHRCVAAHVTAFRRLSALSRESFSPRILRNFRPLLRRIERNS